MDCREACAKVQDYIQNRLSPDELKPFLEHIKCCGECREELEIYFTVDVGIRQLDSETGNYNIKGALETAIEQSRERLEAVRMVKIMRYAVSTLSVMALIITVLLQCRIWLQAGLI